MKSTETQIEELEREIQHKKDVHMNFCLNESCPSCMTYFNMEAKLQTLKECKKMFDDFVEKLKDRRNNPNFNSDMSTNEIIDKLSKEVLGE